MSKKCRQVQDAVLAESVSETDAAHLERCDSCRAFAETFAAAMALPEEECRTPELQDILKKMPSSANRTPHSMVRMIRWFTLAASVAACVAVVLLLQSSFQLAQSSPAQLETASNPTLLSPRVLVVNPTAATTEPEEQETEDALVSLAWDSNELASQLASLDTQFATATWQIAVFDPIQELEGM